MSETRIYLPTPHEKQRIFLDSPAKRKVISAGRRGGKTTGVSRKAIEAALEGRRVLEAAPTADQTGAFWAAVQKALRDAIRDGVVGINKSERLATFPNGGRIRCKTAWNADTLRGDYADLLILDEYSVMKPDAWDEVGAPMLLDNDGDAIFIFTPKRKNHAFTLYNRALSDLSGRWQAFHFTSFDNPYLSAEALAEITSDMTEDAYQQEIEAKFLDNAGAIFRNLGNNMKAPALSLGEARELHRGHRLVAGLDWGKSGDYSAISVGCVDCMQEVAIDRYGGEEYRLQRKRIGALLEQLAESRGRVLLMPERNSIGEPIIEQLVDEGFWVGAGLDDKLGFATTATSKPMIIDSLTLSFEREEFQFINDPVWLGELEAYERTVSRITGRPQYSAPEGAHDDTVIARALMRHAVANSTGGTILW